MSNCLSTFYVYIIHVWYLLFLLWYSHPHNFRKSVMKAVWGEMVILLIVTILINSDNYVQHLGIHHPGNKFEISIFLSQSLRQPVPMAHQNDNQVICPSLHTSQSQICLHRTIESQTWLIPHYMIVTGPQKQVNYQWWKRDGDCFRTFLFLFPFSVCAFAVTVRAWVECFVLLFLTIAAHQSSLIQVFRGMGFSNKDILSLWKSLTFLIKITSPVDQWKGEFWQF